MEIGRKAATQKRINIVVRCKRNFTNSAINKNRSQRSGTPAVLVVGPLITVDLCQIEANP